MRDDPQNRTGPEAVVTSVRAEAPPRSAAKREADKIRSVP